MTQAVGLKPPSTITTTNVGRAGANFQRQVPGYPAAEIYGVLKEKVAEHEQAGLTIVYDDDNTRITGTALGALVYVKAEDDRLSVTVARYPLFGSSTLNKAITRLLERAPADLAEARAAREAAEKKRGWAP